MLGTVLVWGKGEHGNGPFQLVDYLAVAHKAESWWLNTTQATSMPSLSVCNKFVLEWFTCFVSHNIMHLYVFEQLLR